MARQELLSNGDSRIVVVRARNEALLLRGQARAAGMHPTMRSLSGDNVKLTFTGSDKDFVPNLFQANTLAREGVLLSAQGGRRALEALILRDAADEKLEESREKLTVGVGMIDQAASALEQISTGLSTKSQDR
jgi:hypothetical protein